jgi:hypothetical protein
MKYKVFFIILILLIFCKNLNAQNPKGVMELSDLIYYKTYISEHGFHSEPNADTVFALMTDSVYLLRIGCRSGDYLGEQLESYQYADRFADRAATAQEIHDALFVSDWRKTYSDDTEEEFIYLPADTSKILGFAESWSFDTNTLTLEKNVLALVAAVKSYEADRRYRGDYRMLWVPVSTGNPSGSKPSVLSFQVVYDVTIFPGFDEDICESVYNRIEYSERMKFLFYIFSHAYDGRIKVYDTDRSSVLPLDEVRSRLTIIDTVHVTPVGPPYDGDPDTVIFSYISPYEIDKLRFVEEWTFDPNGPTFTKKVIAFAPLLMEGDLYSGFYFVPVFWIYSSE